MNNVQRIFETAAKLDGVAVKLTRISLMIVLIWIGSLKAYKYEADGIVPFVANSPFMSFFYSSKAPEYKKHMNKEGELNLANREWHTRNNTYAFALGLGAVIVAYGLLLGLNPWFPQVSAVASFMIFIMSFVTLSFLITTPETWVQPLGSPEHGFPLLSGAGRLVIKDVIMMGAALVTMADSAKAYVRKLNVT